MPMVVAQPSSTWTPTHSAQMEWSSHSRKCCMYPVSVVRDLSGLPIRLFSRSMAQIRQPELKVSLTHGCNYMALPDGGHIPLREGDGLLYMDCTAVHEQHSIFAGFPASTQITNGAVTIRSSPSVPPSATDKGEFGRVLGLQPQLDGTAPPTIHDLSTLSATALAETLVEFLIATGPSLQPSMTHGAPIAFFPIPFDGVLARTASSDGLVPSTLSGPFVRPSPPLAAPLHSPTSGPQITDLTSQVHSQGSKTPQIDPSWVRF